MALMTAALPALGGVAGSLVASLIAPRGGTHHESAIYQPQTTFNPHYQPRYAPTNQFSPQLSPHYSPESIADQRNSPNFHPRVNVFIGSSEMLELANGQPAVNQGHQLHAQSTANAHSELLNLPVRPAAVKQAPTVSSWKSKIFFVACIAACVYGAYRLRAHIQRKKGAL